MRNLTLKTYDLVGRFKIRIQLKRSVQKCDTHLGWLRIQCNPCYIFFSDPIKASNLLWIIRINNP